MEIFQCKEQEARPVRAALAIPKVASGVHHKIDNLGRDSLKG
jgi:hypothetical protein